MMQPPPVAEAHRGSISTLEDLIGHTPIIELKRFNTGVCRLFIKLESQNPSGSIKDRIALSMIEAVERSGRLSRDGTIVEATAGNTGLGLAQVGLPRGYRLILVVPDKMSREKVQHLRALGADVRMTRSDVGKGHPEYYQDMARRIAAEIPGAFYVNQFSNPANPAAHENTTGPEIWEQLDHDVDAVVVDHASMMGQPDVGGQPTSPGQDAFGAIQEIVRILDADPTTDWSKVDIGALRQHLIDMNEVALHAAADERPLADGVDISITGEGRTLEAIKRMVPAHAHELNLIGWTAKTEELADGVRLTVTTSDPAQVPKLKGLGFMGIMVLGSHHQVHHLLIAKGELVH